MTGTVVVRSPSGFTLPYIGGVYLAVNAVGGARIVVDGPMCAFYKAEFIQGNHQLVADLLRLASPHRVLHTELDIHRAMLGEERAVHRKIRIALNDPETRVVFFIAFSSAVLIGRDIDRIIHEHRKDSNVPLVSIPSRSLDGDWIDGWTRTLTAIAEVVPLDPREGSSPSGAGPRVGIVGNLFLRHEGDAIGDVRELVRLVEGLGVSVASIWLAGQDWTDLSAIGAADLLIALPYGDAAARVLGRRMGVPVVSLPLPFSWTATESFVRGLGAAVGREDRAEDWLAREARRHAADLLFRAEQTLLGTRWVIVDDPVRLSGWMELAADVGAHVVGVGPTAASPTGIPAFGSDPGQPEAALIDLLYEKTVDLAILNGVAREYFEPRPGTRFAVVEFGYPCFQRHPVAPVPSFGLAGEVAVAEMLCEALRSRR